MDQKQPLVTIGIPSYNREALLKRAIDSAIKQDYRNVEIIVSDNASTDGTENLCRYYASQDGRFKYIRQSKNLGPTANFVEVLKNASGQFFMWLGDDDWIDPAYVSSCIQPLINDPTMALVSGASQYYRQGQKIYEGKVFNLSSATWWRRVIVYYAKVADNGMFYGLMKTAQIRKIKMTNTMGGDWQVIANIVSMGKTTMIPEISVHRELGEHTTSYQAITKSLGIAKIQAILPMSSIACSAWMDIVAKGRAFKSRPVLMRGMVGGAVFAVIIFNGGVGYLAAAIRRSLRSSKWLTRAFHAS
jgi:glycosyltransferase involved in cell wall biosynthesis